MRIFQIRRHETGASTTSTNTVAQDNSIPTAAELTTNLLSVTIKPSNVAHKLAIFVEFNCHVNNSEGACVGIFQDAGDAIKVMSINSQNVIDNGFMKHYMIAGTTSPTTFYVRAGTPGGATITMNGNAGGALYGGVLTSSITIIEYAG